jgi:outer membrane protein assembly factor BamB
MMLARRACSIALACACAAAALVGCSRPVWVCGCPAAAKPADALDVTPAGRVRWRVQLGRRGYGLQVSPLAIGAVAVFARSDVLIQRRATEFYGSEIDGMRLADGHRMWSRALSQGIAGMWRWQSLVVVLTEPDPDRRQMQVLTALDGSTGQARWRVPMGAGVAGLARTADGGMAILRSDGVLEVVDLSSGQVRWTRPVAVGASPVAVGGTVVLATNSQLISYDDRTGQVRWTEGGSWPWESPASLQTAAGLVYLVSQVQQGNGGQVTPVVVGISAADGRVRWRLAPRGLLDTLGLDAYAPGLMSIQTSTSADGSAQEELDPATGRVRWRVESPFPAIATPAGTVTAPPSQDRISLRDTLTGRILWTARLHTDWQPLAVGPLPVVAGPWQLQPVLPVVQAGRLMVVPAVALDGPGLIALRISDGHRAWLVTTGPVAAPLSAVPGGILVETA